MSERIARLDQKNEHECGQVCLAMVTGLSRKEIDDALGYEAGPSYGVSDSEMVLLLHRIGRRPLSLRTLAAAEQTLSKNEQSLLGRRLLLTTDQIVEFIAGRVALIRPLNDLHWVVWDRDRVIDPNPLGYDLDDLRQDEIGVVIIVDSESLGSGV